MAAHRGLASYFFEFLSLFTFPQDPAQSRESGLSEFCIQISDRRSGGSGSIQPSFGDVHRAARRTGAVDVSVSFCVYGRDGCYELWAV